jgi:hypothetical protein
MVAWPPSVVVFWMFAQEPAVNMNWKRAALAAVMVRFSWRIVTSDQLLGRGLGPTVTQQQQQQGKGSL